MEDLRMLKKLKSPKGQASLSSLELLPTHWQSLRLRDLKPGEKMGSRTVMKDDITIAIYLESKDGLKLSCGISSVGASAIWVRKTSGSTKARISLGGLQCWLFATCYRAVA